MLSMKFYYFCTLYFILNFRASVIWSESKLFFLGEYYGTPLSGDKGSFNYDIFEEFFKNEKVYFFFRFISINMLWDIKTIFQNQIYEL